MTVMKPMDAAKLMLKVYDDPSSVSPVEAIDIKGVQAYWLKDGVLVIPGTNEFSDWFDFNLDVFNTGAQGHAIEVVPGDSGAIWHAGFLEHAQIVFAFAKPLKPKLIIGHSLGAASAQIVGSSLKVPTIAFASPRTNRGDRRINGDHFVLNICRVDDTVCQVPPGLFGFRHVGHVKWLSPATLNVGEDHRVDQYMEVMMQPANKKSLPPTWPRTQGS